MPSHLLSDGNAAKTALGNFVTQYSAWIAEQRKTAPNRLLRRVETAKELLNRAQVAAKRIQEGIDLLSDPQCLEAFRIANKAMATAATTPHGRDAGEAARVHPTQMASLPVGIHLDESQRNR